MQTADQTFSITLDRFNEGIKARWGRLNNAIRYALVNIANVKFIKLERSSIRILEYSEAAFANKHVLKSQFGHIILLTHNFDYANSITSEVTSTYELVVSGISMEFTVFEDVLDDAVALKSQLEQSIRRTLPMHLPTDSKSLFGIIRKGTPTSGKQIILSRHAQRQACKLYEIQNIGFVCSSENIADNLTKEKKRNPLFEVLQSGSDTINSKQ